MRVFVWRAVHLGNPFLNIQIQCLQFFIFAASDRRKWKSPPAASWKIQRKVKTVVQRIPTMNRLRVFNLLLFAFCFLCKSSHFDPLKYFSLPRLSFFFCSYSICLSVCLCDMLCRYVCLVLLFLLHLLLSFSLYSHNNRSLIVSFMPFTFITIFFLLPPTSLIAIIIY